MLDSVKSEYLSRAETAALLHYSIKWLEAAARKGEGPPFIKFKRRVLYRTTDVRAWIERHAPPLRKGGQA